MNNDVKFLVSPQQQHKVLDITPIMMKSSQKPFS